MRRSGPSVGKTATQTILAQYPHMAGNPNLNYVPPLGIRYVLQPGEQRYQTYQTVRYMGSYYGKLGNFSKHYRQTVDVNGNTEHFVMFDDRLLTEEGFKQVLIVMTKDKYSYLKDTNITDLFKMYSTVIKNKPGEQYLALKNLSDFITADDWKYLEIYRKATDEEDFMLKEILQYQVASVFSRFPHELLARCITNRVVDTPLDEENFTNQKNNES